MKFFLSSKNTLHLSFKAVVGFFFVINLGCSTKARENYQEPEPITPTDLFSWNAIESGTYVSFASENVLFEKNKIPALAAETKEWNTKGWKGEKVHTQFLIWTTYPLQKAQIEWDGLKGKDGSRIHKENIRADFIRYVMTDGEAAKEIGCGIQPGQDSSLVADVIDNTNYLDIAANTTRPVWLSVDIPENIPAGIYEGKVEIMAEGGKKIDILNYTVEVINRILPAPKEWSFHLDLWQNPDAVARVHNVEKWSDEHMELMVPIMKRLADAGQKVITATLIHDPWNSQTFDIYDSMIKWTKKKDGSWSYDYSVFDKWVSYMQSLGINRLIECYSMIPWNLKFYYYDEALGKDTLIVAEPGSPEYEAHWKPMLTDFARHLKEKGWFEKTTIAMDERPMEAMQKTIAIIKAADKDFKVSLAGNYHPEIEADLYDYCVASKEVIDEEVMAERKEKGMVTTFYTCCMEEYPNTFTVSPPAESAWLGWHAAYKGYDGYLRWAYNSWPENPLQDSRFGSWPSGDTYFIYPGNRSSVRFERLIEGIEDYEKIRILKEEFTVNDQQEKLKALDDVLATFEIKALKTKAAGSMLQQGRKVLNHLAINGALSYAEGNY